MPRVAHIELFAASSGSSIRSVLGTHSDFSLFSSFSGLESLECLPRVGDPLPEQLLLLDDDGDTQPLVPIHGMFQVVAGHPDKQPQSAGGTSGYGNAGLGSLEAGIMGEFIHRAELVLQLSESEAEADSGILLPGTITGTLFHPTFQGYMKGVPR
jgi:hypothetical protein